MYKQQVTKKKKEKGFTLVESLISITILMISVAAPLNLASHGLMTADFSQRQIIASYLAQDAIESFVNIKITNRMDREELMNGMTSCRVLSFSDSNGCIIDTLTLDVTPCTGTANCLSEGRMYKSTSSGIYNHSVGTGPDTGFVRFSKMRTVEASNPGLIDQEVEVQTTVQWQSASGETQEYVLTTHMSNW